MPADGVEPSGLVAPRKASIARVLVFLATVGFTAFGGPAAHIAILDREAVRRRSWMTGEEFIDLMGLINLIPGPNSTQMVVYIGLRQRGILGMLGAGLGFIIPASTLILAITMVYMPYGGLPEG